MNTIDLNLWIAFGGLFTAIFTFFIAIFTFLAVREAKKSSQANLWSQLLSEYSSNSMLIALREISNWKEDNPEDFAQKYADLRKKRDKIGYQLDIHRRRISHYFDKLRIFCEENTIDQSLVRRVFRRTTFEFIINVIDPMEKAHREIIIGKSHYPYLKNFYIKFI